MPVQIELYFSKRCQNPNPPVPVNLALFRNRVSAGIKLRWDHRVGLTQYNWYPYKKEKFGHRDRDAQKEEIGEYHLHTKCLKLPQLGQGTGTDPLAQLSKEPTPADTILISELWNNKFILFIPNL